MEQELLQKRDAKYAEFQRSEKGRLGSHKKEEYYQAPKVQKGKGSRGEYHQHYLNKFDDPYKEGLFILVSKLSGCRREKEKRKYEETCDGGYEQLCVQSIFICKPECDQYDKGILEQIVVECPEKLCKEKREESSDCQ